MKLPLAFCCAIALTGANAFAADEAPAPASKPGLGHRMLHPFGGGRDVPATPAPATEKKPGIVHRVLHPFGGGGDTPATPAPVGEKKPGIVSRVLHPFGGGAGKTNNGKLAAEMKLSPLPLKLSETNRLKVTVTLLNHGKKLAPLDFPTSQRIEVLIKNSAGKTIEQWSQDQAFTNEPTVVTINPGERAEYSVEVATRDLSAGQSYLVQGFFPKYDELKAQQTLVPEK